MIMNRYETPAAIKHDAKTLTEDARALLAATAEMTDRSITEARERLLTALDKGRLACESLQDKALRTAHQANETLHNHPYEAMAAGFGVGILVGILLRGCD
jgi:ElaB/YqjD/DUF883 family membrane-anchored ribosome-binding protein